MTFRIVNIFQKKSDMEPTGKYLYVGEGSDLTYICEIKDESLISEDIINNARYINSFIEEELKNSKL